MSNHYVYIILYVYASRQNRAGVFEVNCCSSFSLVVVHMRWADCNNLQNELQGFSPCWKPFRCGESFSCTLWARKLCVYIYTNLSQSQSDLVISNLVLCNISSSTNLIESNQCSLPYSTLILSFRSLFYLSLSFRFFAKFYNLFLSFCHPLSCLIWSHLILSYVSYVHPCFLSIDLSTRSHP